MPRSSLQILASIGSEKESSQQRRALEGLSKEEVENILITEDMCRAVMRFPAAEILDQCLYIHQRMAEEFKDMDDESIDWLLGGSSDMARGGFHDGHGLTAAQKFKAFLGLSKEELIHHPQKLITAIETIATAMGYRAIHATWAVTPFEPETPAQRLMDEKIQNMIHDKLTKPIGAIYTARSEDDLIAHPCDDSIEILARQGDVSSASDCELEDQRPIKQLDSRKFRNEVIQGHLSWIGAAVKGGISVRGHISGTCPLTLSAIDGLCSTGSDPEKSQWLNLDRNFNSLAGAVVVATFERGDYHSIAETAAGVNHYLVERAIKQGIKRVNTPMEPYDAFEYGTYMLVAASPTMKALKDDSLTIKEAMRECRDLVLSRTQEFPAKSIIIDAQNPHLFYQKPKLNPTAHDSYEHRNENEVKLSDNP